MNIPRMNRPARAGGFLLIGVAVIATAIGTASAVSNDDGGDTATPGDTTRSPSSPNGAHNGDTTTTTPGAAPTTTTSTTDGANGTTTAPSTGADGKPSTGANGQNGEDGRPGASGDSEQAAVKSVPVRVYNNSTVRDLASRAAEDLRANGWIVTATGNYSKGTIPASTAYFRPGTDEEAAAQALAEEFGMRAEPRFDGIADSSPGIIVIVTKDYQGAPSGK